jgi:hypothetical protein
VFLRSNCSIGDEFAERVLHIFDRVLDIFDRVLYIFEVVLACTITQAHKSTSRPHRKDIITRIMTMYTAFILATVAVSASAFAPSSLKAVKTTSLSMADSPSYPTINGWTADPTAFCAGLAGSIAPFGEFDPLGFTKDASVEDIKRLREAEVTHGRVGMLAALGFLVGENFHPLFGGLIVGPANSHLAQIQNIAPFFIVGLTGAIGVAELTRATTGWVSPAVSAWTLRDDYYPGDIGFDPLGIKPSDAAGFAEMQTKELNNGRLAMLAAIGMIGQELVTRSPLFGII